ncbi:hypothetical protein D3C75_556280 [compost metagenome]
MTVNATDHVPAVGFETCCGIVSEPAFNVTVDGDAVVVIERNQFAQLQGTCQRAHFVRNAFHHAAIAHERIGEVVNNVMTRTVELRRQRLLSNRHTHCVGNTLTQRAGGGFNACGVTHFRVTWGFGVQLTEVFQLFNWQGITCEVQQAVNQH